jgi:DNA-binding transcriptional ArsR family regulator
LREALGLGQSSLSQHLARLRADGLVESFCADDKKKRKGK